MAVLPTFGGTNDVADLDIGQPESTRQQASQASATLRVIVGAARVAEVVNPMVQQDMVYVDVLGTVGTPIAWEGVIRANSDAMMNTILAEIEQKKTGRQRITGAFDPNEMHSTQMTDTHGRTFNAVRLMDLQLVGPRQASSAWPAIQRVVIRFEELGEVGN